MGYRAWLRAGTEPAYWFGAGRGYADISVTAVAVDPAVTAGAAIQAAVDVVNDGKRGGKQVLQIYAERLNSIVDRPEQWLVGFAAVRLAPGEQRTVVVTIPTRLLAYWDGGWRYEQGPYTLRIGTSSRDLPLSAQVVLRAR